MKQLLHTGLMAAMLTISLHAGADDKTTVKETLKQAPNDKTNYLGDLIKFKFDLGVKVVDTTKVSDDGSFSLSDACAKRQTEFKGLGKTTLGNKPAHLFVVDDTPSGREVTQQAVDVKDRTRPASTVAGTATKEGDGLKDLFRCASDKDLRKGDVVVIASETIETLRARRTGVAFGTLLVPYKYHLRSNKEFSGGATVGGYVGGRIEWTAFEAQYMGFLGASAIEVARAGADGNVNKESHAGLSYGFGLLGTIKDDFQLGVVLGWDRVGKSVGYANNGKPWLAISLGFGFSN